jgi:hypothetical protein
MQLDSSLTNMRHVAHTGAMPRKQRFPVMLDPEQLAALRLIQERTGARVSEQIRRAVAKWIAEQEHGSGRTSRRTRRA